MLGNGVINFVENAEKFDRLLAFIGGNIEMLRRLCLAIASMLALSSCASIEPTYDAVVAPTEVISVSDFLVRGQRSFDSANVSGMKSIVLFTQQNSTRNKRFCESFVKLAPIEVAEGSGIAAEFAPIFWLLKKDVSDRTNCDQILKEYDFQTANLYLQRYGQGLSKGPILIAVDKAGKFAFIDTAKANRQDIARVVVEWAKMFQKGGMNNISVTSPTFLQNLAGLLCNTTTQLVALQTPTAGADVQNPATFGFDATTGKWSKPSLYQVGALVFGGTITNLACSLGEMVT
jgi:hypothetical protein